MSTGKRVREGMIIIGAWLAAVSMLAIGIFLMLLMPYVIPQICTTLLKLLNF